jgi:hypothetical protein
MFLFPLFFCIFYVNSQFTPFLHGWLILMVSLHTFQCFSVNCFLKNWFKNISLSKNLIPVLYKQLTTWTGDKFKGKYSMSFFISFCSNSQTLLYIIILEYLFFFKWNLHHFPQTTPGILMQLWHNNLQNTLNSPSTNILIICTWK